MKTIEERAIKYAKEQKYESTAYEAYRVAAIEQKAIDEEVLLKKCDDMTKVEYDRETTFVNWYLKNGKGIPTYSDAIEWARKDLLDKACEWIKENFEHYIDVEVSSYYIYDKQFVEDFRKAMEE